MTFGAPLLGAALLAFLAAACRGRADAPHPENPAPSSAAPGPGAASGTGLRPLARTDVCTTLGSARPSPTALFEVRDPKLRATFSGTSGRGAELEFRYLGGTEQTAALRSGRERRQLGLELAAQNTCNLVYVMWRIEPRAELVVSIKQNPGQTRHAECENRGYRNLTPASSAPLPTLMPDSVHRLHAQLDARDVLSVHIDGALVWTGRVDAGPVPGRAGMRSDNAMFDVLHLSADAPRPASEGCAAGEPRGNADD
jgi:hypothetical protein